MTPEEKTILLVLNKNSVSKLTAVHFTDALKSRGFNVIALIVTRSEDIPVELFDLSALTPADRDTIQKVVEECTGVRI